MKKTKLMSVLALTAMISATTVPVSAAPETATARNRGNIYGKFRGSGSGGLAGFLSKRSSFV